MSKTILPKFRIRTAPAPAEVEVSKYRQGFAFDFPLLRDASGIMDSGSCLILRFDPSSRLTSIDIMRTAPEIRAVDVVATAESIERAGSIEILNPDECWNQTFKAHFGMDTNKNLLEIRFSRKLRSKVAVTCAKAINVELSREQKLVRIVIDMAYMANQNIICFDGEEPHFHSWGAAVREQLAGGGGSSGAIASRTPETGFTSS